MLQLLESKKTLWWFLTAHFFVWLSLGLFLDIQPDMADHWGWSRHLSFSYYEHPPLSPVIQRLITAIAGNHILTLKIGSVLFTVLILFTAYQVARVYFGRKTATMFLLILETTPYFSMGSVYWHIDEPYMLAWLLGLYSMGKFAQTRNEKWILLFGVCAGFGALAKYITLLFYISLFAWALWDRRARYLLFRWETYVAGIISLTIFSPVLYWNATHEWASFKWQFGRGLSGRAFGEMLPIFTISHLALFSLILSTSAWATLISGKLVKRKMELTESLLLATALIPVLFFSIASLPGTVADPVWVNTGYFGLFLLFAQWMVRKLENNQVKFVYTSLGAAYLFNALIVIIAVLHILFRILPVPLELDNSRNLMGWETTADQIMEVMDKNNIPEPGFVVSREFQVAGVLALYLPFHPYSHTIEKVLRNQWSPVEKVREQGALLFCPPEKCKNIVNEAQKRFGAPLSYVDRIQTNKGKKLLRDFNIYWLKPSKKIK